MRTIKSVKASLFTLIFAFLAIGLIANTSVMNKRETDIKSPKKVLTYETWYFNGSSLDSPKDASKYSKTPLYNCEGEQETICSINAPAQGNNPNLPDLEAPAEVNDPNPPTVEDQIEETMSSPTNKQPNETVLSFREHQ